MGGAYFVIALVPKWAEVGKRMDLVRTGNVRHQTVTVMLPSQPKRSLCCHATIYVCLQMPHQASHSWRWTWGSVRHSWSPFRRRRYLVTVYLWGSTRLPKSGG